jgi:hypothetical protein
VLVVVRYVRHRGGARRQQPKYPTEILQVTQGPVTRNRRWCQK